MAKNAYAKRLDAARAAREYAIRRITRQQMLMVEEQKAEKCPMCGKPLEWDGAENG